MDVFTIPLIEPALAAADLPPGQIGDGRDRCLSNDFMVGPENETLRAIVHQWLPAVLETGRVPAATNPLVLYGPSGCGKSHLAYGIADRLAAIGSARVPVQVFPAMDLARDHQRALDLNQVQTFRQSLDDQAVLIVDDLHHLAGHAKPQLELQCVFERYVQANRPCVVTMHRSPLQVPGILPSLASRLCAGTTLRLRAVSRSTRRVILERYIAQQGWQATPRQNEQIAEVAGESIASLRGAITQLKALTLQRSDSWNGSFQQLIDLWIRKQTPTGPDCQEILRQVAAYFHLPPKTICGSSRSRNVTYARSITIFLCRKHTACTFSEIGKHLNGRDHSTIMHAYRKIKSLLEQSESKTKTTIQDLRQQLSSSYPASYDNR